MARTRYGRKRSSASSTTSSRRSSYTSRGNFRSRVPRPFAETKIVDFPIGLTLSTTPSITYLNGVANGTGDFNRIGNTVSWRYLHMALWINQAAVVPPNPTDYCRVAIVWDRNPNGALPAVPTIFQATDSAGATTSDPFVKANNDTKYRFKILYNQNYFLPAVSAAAALNVSAEEGVGRLRINKFLKLRFQRSRFIGATAAIADIESGAIYIITETQNVAIGVTTSTLQGSIRMAYTDS